MCAFFTTRVNSLHPLTIDNLRKMEPLISDSAANILPGTALDVMIYACTSGTIAIGVKRIEQLIHNTHPNITVTNPVVAALAAFKHYRRQTHQHFNALHTSGESRDGRVLS